MNLTTQLKELADSGAKRHPGEAQIIMRNGIEELEKSNILSNAAKKGDVFPDFKLSNVINTILFSNFPLSFSISITISFHAPYMLLA